MKWPRVGDCLCIRAGPLRSRCQDRMRHERYLLGGMLVKEKGEEVEVGRRVIRPEHRSNTCERGRGRKEEWKEVPDWRGLSFGHSKGEFLSKNCLIDESQIWEQQTCPSKPSVLSHRLGEAPGKSDLSSSTEMDPEGWALYQLCTLQQDIWAVATGIFMATGIFN